MGPATSEAGIGNPASVRHLPVSCGSHLNPRAGSAARITAFARRQRRRPPFGQGTPYRAEAGYLPRGHPQNISRIFLKCCTYVKLLLV
jgi:hypothetical protein